MAFDEFEARRILIREVNWVGDAILTLPALAALDRRYPRAEIVVMAKPWVADLFADQPCVDRVVRYQPEGCHRGIRGRWRLAVDLRREPFDLAVIFPNSIDSALVPWAARIPHRIGFARDGRRALLTHPIRERREAGRHQVERYLDLVRSLGADGGGPPRLAVGPAARDTARGLLAEHGLGAPTPFVVLNPGSVYGGAKRWPAERFAAVADALAESRGLGIVLVGSARETGVLDAVAGRMRRMPVRLGGRTDLPTLAAVLQSARLLLSNDTGAMHVAAAVGTSVLAVFGPTDAVATGPLGPRARVLREPAPCSPCLLRECPIDHRCMLGLGVGAVREAAEQMLEAAGEVPGPTQSRAAFLDRDGTIIAEVGYLRDPAGIRLLPGALDALRALKRAGYRLILVSNQAGVARGLMTEADVQAVNARLAALLRDAGVPLDGVYYCPHHPEHGPPEYRRACDCRKPAPGMVDRAVRELQVDPSRSVIIGDHLTDAEVARHFPGMRGVLLLTGHGTSQLEKLRAGEATPDHVAADLAAAVQWLLAEAETRDATPSRQP